MPRNIFKFLSILIACIVFLLAITNPSIKKLNEFVGDNDGVIRRTENWILFSKFEYSFVSQVYNNRYRDLETYRYVGIFSNFFKINSEKKIIAPKKLGSEKYDWILR